MPSWRPGPAKKSIVTIDVGAKRFAWRAAGIVVVGAAVSCSGAENARSSDTAPVAAPGAEAPATQTSGEQLYQRCTSCHQSNGEGLAGTYPALAASEYATAANVAVPIRIVTRGMEGPLTVKGTQYNGIMPPYGVGIEMTDDEVAAVLTYVRQSWGNRASAVTPEDVAKERATRTTSGPVTAAELKPLM